MNEFIAFHCCLRNTQILRFTRQCTRREYGRDINQLRQKTFTLLCNKFIRFTMYQILSESENPLRFAKVITKTNWLTFYTDLVLEFSVTKHDFQVLQSVDTIQVRWETLQLYG